MKYYVQHLSNPSSSTQRSLLRPRRGNARGYTLLELIIGIVLGALVMVMGVTSVTLAVTVYNQNLNQSKATMATETALNTFSQIMSTATTPNNVASANPGTAVNSVCWGSTMNPAVGTDNLTGAAAPANTAVIIAHDYDFRFCGYDQASPATSPNVYDIGIDYQSCNGTSLGYCTVELRDFGPAGLYGTSGQPAPVVLDTIGNIWCDSYCQSQSSTSPHIACSNLSPTPSSGCSSATAPLFEYYGAAGSTSTALNPSTLPLTDVLSSSSSVSDPANLYLIKNVVMTMTTLSGTTGSISPTTDAPGVTLSTQILLRSA